MGTRFRIVSSLMICAVAISLATGAGSLIAQTHV
jgi:hypothetical protein